MLGYSEMYFIRLFTRCVGMQPHRYAVTVRMSHAAKHLISGKSVQETADMLGYSYAGNFNRDFRKYFSISPGRYAQTRRGGP
jgi:AraC-like DNA-binding protein